MAENETETFYIFRCPECGGLTVSDERQTPLSICIHTQGRGKPRRVIERVRIPVVPRDLADAVAAKLAEVIRDPLNCDQDDSELVKYREAVGQ